MVWLLSALCKMKHGITHASKQSIQKLITVFSGSYKQHPLGLKIFYK